MPNASVGYVQAFRCERRRTDAQTRRRLRQLSSSEARKRRGDNKFHFLRVRHGSGDVRLLAGCKQGHGYSICRIHSSSFTHTNTHRPKNSIFLSRGGCKEKVPRCSLWYHGRSARSRVGATRSGSVQTRRSAQATGRHLTSHMTCSVLIATLCLVFLVPYFEYFPGSLR